MEKNMVCAAALNNAYEAFKIGGISKRDFEERVFQYLIEIKHKFRYQGLRDDDVFVDFLCGSYPKISGTLDRYVPIEGVPFNVYLFIMVRHLFRGQKSKEAQQTKIETVFWDDCARDSLKRGTDSFSETSSLWGDPEQSAVFESFFAAITARQRLILLLKVYHQISEDLVEKLAPSLHCTPSKLSALIESMRDIRTHRDACRNELKEHCYQQHYRCLSYQARLTGCEKNSEQYKIFSARLERGRLRLTKMRLRLRRMRAEASNKQIADLLGIPKGSVDSAFFSMQKKLRSRHTAVFAKFFPRSYQQEAQAASARHHS